MILSLLLALVAAFVPEARAVHLSCVDAAIADETSAIMGFAESDFLILHPLSKSFISGLPGERTQYKSIGDLGPKGWADANAVFIRDVYPLSINVTGADGHRQPALLIYPNFKALVAGRGVPYDGGSTYAPVPRPAAMSPDARLYQPSASGFKWVETRRLPLLVEGGNLVGTARFIITSDKILTDNSRSIGELQAEIAASAVEPSSRVEFIRRLREEFDYQARDRLGVLGALAQKTGVGVDHIVVTPWMPGERTGHADIHTAQVRGDVVAVPYIPRRLIEALGYGHERDFARGINRWLEERIAQYKAAGMTVERVPMLPPKDLQPSALSSLGWDAQFLSTVQWMRAGNVVYVPIYERYLSLLPARDQAAFKREITMKLRRYGLRVEFKDASAMIGTNGGFHCISASFPDVAARAK